MHSSKELRLSVPQPHAKNLENACWIFSFAFAIWAGGVRGGAALQPPLPLHARAAPDRGAAARHLGRQGLQAETETKAARSVYGPFDGCTSGM